MAAIGYPTQSQWTSSVVTWSITYGNSYSRSTYEWPSSPPSRHLSRAERRMRDALAREEKSKLLARLRREEANRKAMNDAKSRAREAPATGSPPAERNLQTYDDAMAARMAARRVA